MSTRAVTIPGLPPSLNHLYPTGRSGRRFLSAEGREWHRTVADACVGARLRAFDDPKTPLVLRLVFVGMTYKRDVTNAIKATEDALAEALGFADRYVCAVSASRGEPDHKGQQETRVQLTVLQEKEG